MFRRLVDFDPLEQLITNQLRVELWESGELVSEEEHTLKMHMYFKHELLMMLEKVGFGDITVQGDYTEVEATPEHNTLVFIASK